MPSELQPFEIRRMQQADLAAAACVHQAAFVRQCRSQEWLACNLAAFPRMVSYVALADSVCIGYVIWTQKSGFRPEVVLELEQIAVAPNWQGKGVGQALIEQSLRDVQRVLQEGESVLKHIIVTTRTDNHAQKLYTRVLGAKVEAVISNLYSADEVVMVARHATTSREPGETAGRPSLVTYYLEMTDPKALKAKPVPDVLRVVESEVPEYRFNRFLYELVGSQWQWGDLDQCSDAQWRARVEDNALRTWVAYYRGSVAGYYELHRPDGINTEILYFGLAPGLIGKGFGGPMLSHAIQSAWSWGGTRRVWVHTCTLDHPAALANYQARGMTLYRQEDELHDCPE